MTVQLVQVFVSFFYYLLMSQMFFCARRVFLCNIKNFYLWEQEKQEVRVQKMILNSSFKALLSYKSNLLDFLRGNGNKTSFLLF